MAAYITPRLVIELGWMQLQLLGRLGHPNPFGSRKRFILASLGVVDTGLLHILAFLAMVRLVAVYRLTGRSIVEVDLKRGVLWPLLLPRGAELNS